MKKWIVEVGVTVGNEVREFGFQTNDPFDGSILISFDGYEITEVDYDHLAYYKMIRNYDYSSDKDDLTRFIYP